ncbi:hypothetical protein ACTXJU_15245 [Glutamicibacter ardleyensis]|uniref:hypothetical protein n=1 Tax=Glutamicibacter ardleyensis TaxID=225894 RepID=UPI003FB988C7
MSILFNPPPAWRAYLPEDFVPAADWIPERAWGAPPVGWPMWVESTTGAASEPPIEYQANPYLYMSVMPAWDAPETSQRIAPDMASRHKPKKRPLSRGKKIGLGVVAGVLVIGVIGALGGAGDEQPAPVAASPSPSAVEANATLESTVEPTTISSASAEAEASAKRLPQSKNRRMPPKLVPRRKQRKRIRPRLKRKPKLKPKRKPRPRLALKQKPKRRLKKRLEH